MKTIPKKQNNLGGIATVYAVPAHLIPLLEADPVTGLGAIPEFPSESAYTLYPVFQSGTFREEMATAAGGSYWEQTLTFSLAKNSPVVNQLIGELVGRTWAVVIRDQNNHFLVAGNCLYPLRLTVKSDTGSELSDLNTLSFTFSASSPTRAVYIVNPL